MPALRLAGRVAIALLSFAVVVVGLAVALGFAALSIDWELPEQREILGPSSVFDRDGRPLARFAAEVERREVPLDAISHEFRMAVVAAEDHRFFDHRGVDPIAVLRAVFNNVRHGSIREGGSTLTQQFVKNAYVGDEISLWRKVREAIVSIQLEKEMTKEEILAAYLNRVYFGEGAYGAEAAALTYFDKPAAAIALHEAALLASVLPEPSAHSPFSDPEGALARRNVVLQEMATYGLAQQADVDAAMALPLGLVLPNPPPQGAPYFTEEARRQLLEAFGPELLYHGGLVISTTIDLDLQAELELRMQAHLPATPGFEPAVAVVEPATGDVLAAWSGRDFAASQVDLALGQDYGRPSGSTFKVFALATALEEGWTLSDSWPAPGEVTIGGWSPRGGGCGGRCTLLQATVSSVNTVFAQVAHDVGAADFPEMARRLGVRSTLRDDDLTQVLGTSSVTPLDMASAMATLANDGVACPARVISSVSDHLGAPLPAPDPRQPTAEERAEWRARMLAEGFPADPVDHGRCYRAVDAAVARQVTVALRGVVAGGTGQRADIGRPQAGKTGTTSDSTQVWFAGYTPDLALAVMVSHRDGDVPLTDLPGCSAACYGGQLPARIWADVASGLLAVAGLAPRDFPEPLPLPGGSDSDDGGDRPAAPAARPAAAAPAPPAAPSPEATTAPTAPPAGVNPGYTPTPTPAPQPSPTGEEGLLGDLLDLG